jgi:hypothetical protein
MVKVAEVDSEFPHSSVAVKVTVTEPVAPQAAETEVKSLLQVTEEQLSEAEAPPLAANHAFSSATLPLPSHSTVKSVAEIVIVGAVVS